MDARQGGFSLISVMVGLVISLLAVLGMMNLYAVMGRLTAESGGFAQIAGDQAAAMLTANAYLQRAGFRVSDADPETDLRLCDDLVLNGEPLDGNCAPAADHEGNALLWRFKATGCEGLWINEDGGLEYLFLNETCGNSGFSEASWSKDKRLVLYRPPTAIDDDDDDPVFIVKGAGFYSLDVDKAACSPYGVSEPIPGSVQIRLEAHQPTSRDGYDADDEYTYFKVESRTCLANFHTSGDEE